MASVASVVRDKRLASVGVVSEPRGRAKKGGGRKKRAPPKKKYGPREIKKGAVKKRLPRGKFIYTGTAVQWGN